MKRVICIFVLALALAAGEASAQSVLSDPRAVPPGNVQPLSRKEVLAPQMVTIPTPGDRRGPKPPSGTRLIVPKKDKAEEEQR